VITLIFHRAGAKAALAYMRREGCFRDRGPSEAIIGGSFPLGTSSEEIIQEFDFLRKLRPDCRKPVAHLVISFPVDDRHLEPSELLCIVDKVITKLRLEKGPFAVVEHHDNGLQHVHIMASTLTYTGIRTEMRGERLKCLRISREIEKDHGLWRLSNRKGAGLLPPLPLMPPGHAPGHSEAPLEASETSPRNARRPWSGALKMLIANTLSGWAGGGLAAFRDALGAVGIELVPRLHEDGSGITGLGYRFDGEFEQAGRLGYPLSVLRKQGVDYRPEVDLPLLSRPLSGAFHVMDPPPPTARQSPSSALPNPPMGMSPMPTQEMRHAETFRRSLRAFAPALSATLWAALARPTGASPDRGIPFPECGYRGRS